MVVVRPDFEREEVAEVEARGFLKTCEDRRMNP
jgi:hypothetical protein